MKSTEYFIAQRIVQNKNGTFANVSSRLAIISVGVGVFALLLAFSILGGFQQKVSQKIYDFDAHLRAYKYTANNQMSDLPVSTNSHLYKEGLKVEGIRSMHSIAYLQGVLHANEHVVGMMVKGYGDDFDTTNFVKNLKAGRFVDIHDTTKLYAKEVVLSQRIAQKIGLKVGDKANFYFFIRGNLRPRKLTVVGIYQTGLEEFDDRVAIVDLGMIQKFNRWDDTLVGGFEFMVDDVTRLAEIEDKLFYEADYEITVENIEGKYRYLFDWLALLNQNVNILIIIVFAVAFFNVISIMYILIMEQNQMIGVMKALGATNAFIKKIFFFMGAKLLLKGLVWGNTLALVFCFLQDYFKLIPLDPENYHMDAVPILWDWVAFVGVNLGALIFIGFVLFIPILRITKVVPIKSIKFS
ncbi:MAG: ABC transporter permease [Cytophagales bacterium]|nr:ABC transporter permease [Cytophagales bacterium]